MKLIVVFEKTPRLRHIGHLDLMRAMQRALRRSGLPLRYSQGFNPHILLTFAAPLSVGMPGKREIMEVLDEVKDMNYRLILEKRYLCFESWPKIGEDMGHSDRWAQLKHQAALRVVQQILDKRAA